MAEPSPDKIVIGAIGPLITTVIGAAIGWLSGRIDGGHRLAVDGSAYALSEASTFESPLARKSVRGSRAEPLVLKLGLSR